MPAVTVENPLTLPAVEVMCAPWASVEWAVTFVTPTVPAI